MAHRRPGRRRPGAGPCAAMLVLLAVVCPDGAFARFCAAVPAGMDWAASGSGAVPGDAALVARGARVGKIYVEVGNIFDTGDPAEDRRVFHLVNNLHRRTRDGVILRQLLFAPGDLYSPRLLKESERLLRRNRYLFDAEIRPVAYRDGLVDVEVVARDVWTLSGGVRVSRQGGENKVQFEIQDYNFLGTGKDLTANQTTTVDRTSTLLRYRDYNVAGSRVGLDLWFSENSDGHLRRLDLERPFYALDTRWAAGVRAEIDDRVDSLYTLGKIDREFRHEAEYLDLFWGRSSGLVDGRARRWKLGLTVDRHRFDVVPRPKTHTAAPPDRTLVFPWVGLDLVEDRFIEIRDLDKMARTEDLNLGRRVGLRLGWSSPAFGGDRDQAVIAVSASGGLKPGDGKLVLASAYAEGRWGGQGWENFLAGASARLFWRNWGRHLLYVEAAADVAHRLDAERQLLLGGDSGLRGYPLRYQEGDRRVLITVEQRFFTDLNLFRLANLGGAVFVDVGQAWFAGPDPPQELGLLADFGIGLRLSPSRSGRGTMLHFDLAIPLGGDPSIESLQWLVTTHDTF